MTTDENFDEVSYLGAYPDVKSAVDSGIFPSGWEHYRTFGKNEGREAWPLYKKTEIIRHLAKKYGKQHYLELCTHTTGNFYNKIDRSILKSCRRLMYNCPDYFEDDSGIDYRVKEFDIAEAISRMVADGLPDICLLDAWHTHEFVMRDLALMHGLMPDGGILVVHDVLPPSELVASPKWRIGDWVGLVYKAFLDFVFAHGLDYCTIDTDYGCGIIVKNRRLAPIWPADETGNLKTEWQKISATDPAPYHYLMANKEKLLHLIPVKTFLGQFKIIDAP